MKDKAESLGIKVDGRWSDERIQQEIDKVDPRIAIAGKAYDDLGDATKFSEESRDEAIKSAIKSDDKFNSLYWANERAAKIWEGQSASLSIIERVGRIRAALKDKGFTDFDNLIIPTDEDYRKFL